MEISLTGVLVPAGWGEDGEPSEVALMTDDEGEHLLDLTCCDLNIASHMNNRVRIEGALMIQGRKYFIKPVRLTLLSY